MADLLLQEASEDAQLRAHFGADRWSRPASEQLNMQLLEKIEKFRATLEAAGQSDKTVRKKFGEWEGTLQLLEGNEVRVNGIGPAA